MAHDQRKDKPLPEETDPKKSPLPKRRAVVDALKRAVVRRTSTQR